MLATTGQGTNVDVSRVNRLSVPLIMIHYATHKQGTITWGLLSPRTVVQPPKSKREQSSLSNSEHRPESGCSVWKAVSQLLLFFDRDYHSICLLSRLNNTAHQHQAKIYSQAKVTHLIEYLISKNVNKSENANTANFKTTSHENSKSDKGNKVYFCHQRSK